MNRQSLIRRTARRAATAALRGVPGALPHLLVSRYQRRSGFPADLALLFANYALKAARAEITVRLGGRTISGSADDVVLRYLYVFGIWEPAVTRRIATALNPGDTFIDIGANIGYYSELAMHRVGPTGRVVAVEPEPELAAGLRQLGGNGRVDVVEVALSDTLGHADLHVGNSSNRGHSSLIRDATHGESVRVEVMPLDILVSQLTIDPAGIGALKIDVEGAERGLLAGASGTLAELRPGAAVFIEFADPAGEREIDAHLTALGFAMQPLNNSYRPWRYRIEREHPAAHGTYPYDAMYVRVGRDS